MLRHGALLLLFFLLGTVAHNHTEQLQVEQALILSLLSGHTVHAKTNSSYAAQPHEDARRLQEADETGHTYAWERERERCPGSRAVPGPELPDVTVMDWCSSSTPQLRRLLAMQNHSAPLHIGGTRRMGRTTTCCMMCC